MRYERESEGEQRLFVEGWESVLKQTLIWLVLHNTQHQLYDATHKFIAAVLETAAEPKYQEFRLFSFLQR